MIKLTSPYPAGDHLFDVREEADRKVLPKEQARQFHRKVAQLLFICKRARPYIEPLVSFLGTRLKDPDGDNLGKVEARTESPERYAVYEEAHECRMPIYD